MRRYTLDTSCVIHAVQQQAQASAVETLVDAARNNQVRLFMTNAFDADMTRASASHLQANLTWLAAQPVVQGVPGPLRLDYSTLGGGDVLASEASAALATIIEQIVLPAEYQVGELRPDDPEFMAKWRRKVNDVQHLAAHLAAGHDAFVTSDEDDIVKKRDRLHAATGLVVLTPAEARAALTKGEGAI